MRGATRTRQHLWCYTGSAAILEPMLLDPFVDLIRAQVDDKLAETIWVENLTVPVEARMYVAMHGVVHRAADLKWRGG